MLALLLDLSYTLLSQSVFYTLLPCHVACVGTCNDLLLPWKPEAFELAEPLCRTTLKPRALLTLALSDFACDFVQSRIGYTQARTCFAPNASSGQLDRECLTATPLSCGCEPFWQSGVASSCSVLCQVLTPRIVRSAGCRLCGVGGGFSRVVCVRSAVVTG